VRDRERLPPDPPPWYYEIQSLGLNYRMSDLHAALGRSQLRKLERFVARRRAIVARYREGLADLASIELPVESPDVQAAWHLFAIRVKGGAEPRARLSAALRVRQIGTQLHYLPVNAFPYYRELGYSPDATPIASRASSQLLSLPLYPALSDGDVDRVIAGVRVASDDLA
jgi:perosamine synthetase